jgi:DNA polymerase III delta subunit
MIIFFYGNDPLLKRRAKDAYIEEYFKKNPSAVRLLFSDTDFSQEVLSPLMTETNLFGTKNLIELYNIFDREDGQEFVLGNLQAFKESQNTFIFIENTLLKDPLSKIEKAKISAEYFETRLVKKEFNSFALTDAFASRNKKNTWILFRQAIEQGTSIESIIGTLFWQIKTLLLVKTAKKPDASALGLNPFVLKKTLTASARFTETEIRNIFSRLVGIYHDSHRGVVDGEIALEQFLLESLA